MSCRSARYSHQPSSELSIDSFTQYCFTQTRPTPWIEDLGMSDLDYAQALVEGRDPHQENAFVRALMAEGIDPADARRVAPFLAKYPRSPEEQGIVFEVWRKWCVLRSIARL